MLLLEKIKRKEDKKEERKKEKERGREEYGEREGEGERVFEIQQPSPSNQSKKSNARQNAASSSFDMKICA